MMSSVAICTSETLISWPLTMAMTLSSFGASWASAGQTRLKPSPRATTDDFRKVRENDINSTVFQGLRDRIGPFRLLAL